MYPISCHCNESCHYLPRIIPVIVLFADPHERGVGVV